jgi:hypothetical protein
MNDPTSILSDPGAWRELATSAKESLIGGQQAKKWSEPRN